MLNVFVGVYCICVCLMQEELKVELGDLRRQHLEMLKSQADQIRETERAVYENGVMLEQVSCENSRLHVVSLNLTWDWSTVYSA